MLICLTSLSGKAFSQENSSNPGIIESFERLLELHKEQYQKNKMVIQSNLRAVSDLSNFTDVKIDSDYMKSILFHSEERFLLLARKNECAFLSVLETNLFKTVDGNIDNILINYKNKDGTTASATMLKDDFFDQIYKKKCLNNREYSIIFNDTNVQKTVEGIKFTVPRTKAECNNVHKEWLDNPYTPYLCRIQQVFKKPALKKTAELYRERIPLMQRIYLDNLCNSLSNPEMFCANYLKSDVWNKILNSEIPDYKMSYKCQQLFNKKETLSNQEIKNCASKLASDSTFCETRGNSDYPSNFPLQNCNNISIALNKSKLLTEYHDCPGKIDNEALTNIHRIVNHFNPRKIINNKESCSSEASYTLARLNFDIKNQDGWPLKICYYNNVEKKETCRIYVPGARSDEPLSEDQVVAKILYQQKGANQKTICRIVDSKTYNPLRSEYKYGCYIVYNADSCTTIDCDKKVIWEEKVQTDIRFVGVPTFDYFPTDFLKERFSFNSLIDDSKGTQQRPIRNLTDLKFFLDKMSNGIIHGIGCAEDLMPEQFQRIAINECHPLPFIVDGHVEKNNESLMIARLSIDDIHTPRLLSWPHIFNAVSGYQEMHPLNTWTLNGIRK